MRKRTVSAVVILFALLAGCGTSGSEPRSAPDGKQPEAAPAPQRDDDCQVLAGVGPRLAAVDNAFGPDCITVRSDAVLYVQNFGTYKHSFTISEEDFGSKPFLVDVTLPGRDTKPTLIDLSKDLEVGSYEFFCTYHGSMDGVIEVIAPVGG